VDFGNDFFRTIESLKNKKWHGKEISFSIKNETGSQFVKLFGGTTEGQPIFTFSKDKDETGKLIKLEIPLNKRFDKEVIDTVANFKKIKVLDNEFITEVDAIDYILENKIDFDGKRVVVVGEVDFDLYKGKVYQKYYLTGIYEAKEDQDDGFIGNMAMFFNEDALEETYKKGNGLNYSLIEKERKLPITIYIEKYNKDKATRSEKPNFYIPIGVVLNISDKFDFSNEKHMKRLGMLAESFIVKKGVYEMGWEVRYHKGSEKTEITMNDLTKFEKMQIENGVKTFEEIVKGKQVWGEFTEEIQLIRFHSSYENGLEETPLTDEDLEVLFFEADLEGELDKVKPKSKVEEIDDDEDLF